MNSGNKLIHNSSNGNGKEILTPEEVAELLQARMCDDRPCRRS